MVREGGRGRRGDSMAKAHLGWAYGRAGRTEEARAILDELTSRYLQEKFSPSNFVFVYQRLGDLDNAFVARALLRESGLLFDIPAGSRVRGPVGRPSLCGHEGQDRLPATRRINIDDICNLGAGANRHRHHHR